MLKITPIPAFHDNYLWLLQASEEAARHQQQEGDISFLDEQGRPLAFVVDPGDAAPVLAHLEEAGLALGGILITHHHKDHTDGIDALLARFPVPVYGPASSRIPQITHILQEGDSFEILGVHFQVLDVPGHTLDHIAYFAPEPVYQHAPLLFCGDTLFVAGCGRIFEGNPKMMHQSLAKLAALPGETLVFCAHEYTLANLAFARAVLPEDEGLAAREAQAWEARQQGQPTVPTQLAEERRTNPFLRSGDADVLAAAQDRADRKLEDEAQVFAVIRDWKDNF